MAESPDMLGWMQTLSDMTRVRLLRLVDGQELTVAELCAVVQLPQSTVSRHLKVLGADGWVDSRREGTSRLYQMTIDLQGGGGGGGGGGGENQEGAMKLWQLLRSQMESDTSARADDRRLEKVLADRQTRSQAFFSSEAGRWDKLREELYGSRFDLLGLLALLDDNWVVGDLGCGTGQVSQSLARYVKRVVAVDESGPMLKTARQRLKGLENVEVRRGNLTTLPLEKGELDAAIMMLVLQHVADPGEVLQEIGRVVKPGGRVLIVNMMRHERSEYQKQMGHVWLGFEEKQIKGWLKGAGFGSVKIHALEQESKAKGPSLFVATGKKPNKK